MSAARAPLRIAVVGCGLIGRRRARTAARHEATTLAAVVDPDRASAEALRREYSARIVPDWRAAVEDPEIDAVVVCTPNAFLAEIGRAALERGKHVLLEKPMGRNADEARALAEAARASGRVLKVGFNHRYHPALRRARALVRDGEIGPIVNIRARYGHGSRPGCEHEWRADPELAGGGELVDQGVHIADLIHWFAGPPAEAFGVVQTAVWPIRPLEDNAYGIFRFPGGAVAQFHVSMTQWKNLFSFEVHGERGALSIDGLGGSYGTERLTRTRRKPEGGVPWTDEEEFPGPDESWAREWDDFARALASGEHCHGGPDEGVQAMRMIDALYRSAETGAPVKL